MERYGDLERLEKHFYNCADECRNTCDEWGAKCFETAMKATKNQPTADVVPKSEIAEIIGAFDTWLYKHYNGDISDLDLYKLFAELKKKYTEGQA